MKQNVQNVLKAMAIVLLLTVTAVSLKAQSAFVELQLAGQYQTAVFAEGATEIAAYDENTGRLFSVNAFSASVDVIDINDPANPSFLFTIDLTSYGAGANSVSVYNGVVAAAVENDVKQLNGKVVFFDTDGTYLNEVEVGALPDMVTFTPNGQLLLVANEGEPDDDYLVDPIGSISIIDVSGGVAGVDASDVTTLDFSAYNSAVLDPSIKINGPGATVAQDLEPEYIAVSQNSKVAWVTIQDNNAMAIINLVGKEIVDLVGLGYKDHSLPGNGLDASDKADDIDIRNWPVKGLYQPDAIAFLKTPGGGFLVTANEGDSRDYDGFSEEERIKDVVLDSLVFPNYTDLQNEDSIGRLKIISTLGDTDNDGEYEELYTYGARSFSVWDVNGNLVYDSGDELEQFTAALYPDNFNASNDNQDLKNRSDDKGPEPEAITTGSILKAPYMFLGLERIGGVAIYDMANPAAPVMVDYDNTRDFTFEPELDPTGDYGPEGLLFIPGNKSPNGRNLLVASNEVSGSIAIYYTDYQCSNGKVAVCYEGTSYCLPVSIAEALVSLGAVPGACGEGRFGQFLDEEALSYGISVYPNPASDYVNIVLNNLTAGEWTVQLFDLTGRAIQQSTVVLTEGQTMQTVHIGVQHLPEGTYICKATSLLGESLHSRIIITR